MSIQHLLQGEGTLYSVDPKESSKVEEQKQVNDNRMQKEKENYLKFYGFSLVTIIVTTLRIQNILPC